MFGAAVMAVWHRHRRRVLDNWLGSPGRVSSATPVNNGRAMVERAARSLIELMPWFAISDCRSHGGPPQCQAPQHIVGEREPQQHGTSLVFAAHPQPGEPHAARPGIG